MREITKNKSIIQIILIVPKEKLSLKEPPIIDDDLLKKGILFKNENIICIYTIKEEIKMFVKRITNK